MKVFSNFHVIDKEAFAIVFISGVALGLGSLFYKFSPDIFIICFLFGNYVSFAALPYLDAEKWKPKPLICSFLGMIGAAMFAWTLDWSLFRVGLLAVSGLIIGYFAPLWSKYA